MAKRKPAAKPGGNGRVGRAKRAPQAPVSSAGSSGRASKSSAPAKAARGKSPRPKPVEGKSALRANGADKKTAVQEKRVPRRAAEAGMVRGGRRGSESGPVAVGKGVRMAGRMDSGDDIHDIRKTNLSEADLTEFRDLLLEKRRELVGDVNNLTDEARRVGAPGGTASSMPIHMADLGSDTWEQELTLGLIENERSLLREIDEALDRIEKKTYGICIATNKPIGKARLRFKPWAKYCIEYARKRELGLA